MIHAVALILEPSSFSLEMSNFSYIIDSNICFLCICDKLYPKQLGFNYLEEIQKEFLSAFGGEVEKAGRPYAFIKFDSTMQKLKKQYKDSRSQRNLTKLNDELTDVTRIMTKNIQDVLQRGEKMDRLSQLSSQLSSESKKYAKNARQLNIQAMYRKYGPPIIVLAIILLILYLRSYFQ